MLRRARETWRAAAPFRPEYAARIRARWEALPAHARHEAQMLGQNTTGCEGTQGVFPACNFSCSPCYHSKDANHVPVSREHTLREVERQLRLLRERLGDPAGGQHCQLIGGEVTLLGPRAHAEALLLMERHNRIPMSFTHGDFDYEYLERLVAESREADPRGRGLTHLAFAGHFDTTMVGRRGRRAAARTEAELDPFRRRFCDMFRRLRREHGVTSYLAHNMTVTPRNVREIPDVVRAARDAGWNMVSFQPAAYLGVAGRWKERFEEVAADDGARVWARVEEGAGRSLPFTMLQTGDRRCNRTVWGLYVGDEYHPLWEEGSEVDRRWRDSFLRIGRRGGSLYDPRAAVSVLRLARALAADPRGAAHFVAWAARLAWRCGPLRLLTRPVRPFTFVMHRFMHAADVREAEELRRSGGTSDDPRVRETMERLDACFYSMAHPDTGELVPACVQHAVLDPEINARLRLELGGEKPVTTRAKRRKQQAEAAEAAAAAEVQQQQQQQQKA